MVLNGRILNGVLTPCGWPAAPSLELSMNRCEAVDFGLQASEGVGGDIVLSASSWHSRRAYQHSLRLKTIGQSIVRRTQPRRRCAVAYCLSRISRDAALHIRHWPQGLGYDKGERLSMDLLLVLP
jgi:hypothetical protein